MLEALVAPTKRILVGLKGSYSNVLLNGTGSTRLRTTTSSTANTTGAPISMSDCTGWRRCSSQFFHMSSVKPPKALRSTISLSLVCKKQADERRTD